MHDMPPQNTATGCRQFFILVQVLHLLAWGGLLTETFSNLCAGTLMITTALLLFVLPWFWASLRYVALVGWLLAAGSLLSLLLYAQGDR